MKAAGDDHVEYLLDFALAKANAVVGAVALARSLIDRGTELDAALAELEMAVQRTADLITTGVSDD